MMLTATVLSMWISNTATTAILLPILVGTLPAHDDETSGRQATGSILAVAYASSIGGLGTPVGSPPNLITMRLLQSADVQIDFLDWIQIGLPMVVVLSIVAFGYLRVAEPAPAQGLAGGQARRASAPMSRAEKVTAVSFALAVVGWMTPAIATALDLSSAPVLTKHLSAGGVALLSASLLFMVPERPGAKARVLSWSEAVKIDWGLVMLFGGGLSMGKQMFDSGLADSLGRGFIELSGVQEQWTLVAVVTVFTLFFTEICSNTATAR
jgi:sodium-dependent dicarboxylate transporter 2/3/5